MLHKAWNSKGEMPYRFPRSSVQFQGHKVQNITDFDPTWAFPDYRPVAAFRSLRFALFPILPQFYVPFYVKKTKIDYFMCLFEFEYAKRLKVYSQVIPRNEVQYIMIDITCNIALTATEH